MNLENFYSVLFFFFSFRLPTFAYFLYTRRVPFVLFEKKRGKRRVKLIFILLCIPACIIEETHFPQKKRKSLFLLHKAKVLRDHSLEKPVDKYFAAMEEDATRARKTSRGCTWFSAKAMRMATFFFFGLLLRCTLFAQKLSHRMTRYLKRRNIFAHSGLISCFTHKRWNICAVFIRSKIFFELYSRIEYKIRCQLHWQ